MGGSYIGTPAAVPATATDPSVHPPSFQLVTNLASDHPNPFQRQPLTGLEIAGLLNQRDAGPLYSHKPLWATTALA
jgi:hypothetical protein